MHRWHYPVLVLTLVILAAMGCGKKEDELSGLEKNSKAVSSPNTGSILGKVLLKGTPPAPGRLSVVTDPYCGNVDSGSVKDESVVVEAAGELANVLVYVKQGAGECPALAKPAILDQRKCVFIPHVLGVQVGQPLEIRNSDKTLHNIHLFSKNNAPFNVGQISGGKPYVTQFEKPEVMMELKCDCHSWMQCFVGALPNPFFCVTGKDGTYQIKGLLPGNYTVAAWHEVYGESPPKKVEVKQGQAIPLDFTFNAQ